jgi:hypothetical protein
MRNFFTSLKHKNRLLFWLGWANLLGAFICLFMMSRDDTQVMGINAWIKPFKFYISITMFAWTIAWLLDPLKMPRRVKYYSWMAVIVLAFEMFVITWQAANGRLSHYNITSPLYAILFSLMGIAISILAVWTAVMAYYFFKRKEFDVPHRYIWGIRLGLILFVIFSFEGGLMASQLAHTVGAPDGSEGLPLVNWSRQYGDLRIAHFFGMHALQLLPLTAYYLFRTSRQVIVAGIIYFLFVSALFIRALMGFPLY